MQVTIKYLTVLMLATFLLHVIWENTQAPLYAGYQSFLQHFPICFVGAMGDVMLTLFVLAFMGLVKKDQPQTMADFLALTIIGFIVAIAIEQHALLIGKWSYALAMPLIPWLNVGLMPILQMTILLPLSCYITGLFSKKIHE